MKRYLIPLVLSVLCLPMVACSDSDGDSPTLPTGSAIDREAILGSVEDVRALIRDNAGSVDPMIVQDVDYKDNELTVKLAESQDGIDSSQLESLCGEISKAVSLFSLKLTVEKANGSEDASCQFSG